ncbi:Signal peptidase complex catalytic subunit SEC11 [Rhizoctonia solani]|uniref:Signal peptidase complex catalytic subunit SEC11 n=1 Tax=Rhizoctonia solani TaxID=456999 RepID=A0A8H7I924_9AGAM|nr:Signal peptidase complex catalytic subunit SEC11 [Rhizoctonia solani]
MNFAMVISTGLMVWKGLGLATNTESPIVVVLSGSMEPAFYRGDLLFLTNFPNVPYQIGDITVYKIPGQDIPIVHRVLETHTQIQKCITTTEQLLLTKGDNNSLDDIELYRGLRWLSVNISSARFKGKFLPYVGYATIAMNDFPQLKLDRLSTSSDRGFYTSSATTHDGLLSTTSLGPSYSLFTIAHRLRTSSSFKPVDVTSASPTLSSATTGEFKANLGFRNKPPAAPFLNPNHILLCALHRWPCTTKLSMDGDAPFDTSDPRTRLALKLLRLQVLTPLSVLINVAANLVCALVISPSMADIMDLFPNGMTPKTEMVGFYMTVVYVLLIGFCVLLITARNTETKETLVNGVGLRLVVVNWLMTAWAALWALQLFIPSTIVLGIVALLLGWIMFSLVCLFIALEWNYPYTRPDMYARKQWEAFAFIVSMHAAGVLWVFFRQDLTITIGGLWIVLSILLRRPKGAPVFAALIIFAVLYPLTYISTMAWKRLRRHEENQGRIALPPDEEESVEGNHYPNGNGTQEDAAVWGGEERR